MKIERPKMQPEATEEKLTPNTIKVLKENLKCMNDLDKIKLPLEVRIFSGEQQWTYRNDAYREMVNKMDLKQKHELETLIKNN